MKPRKRVLQPYTRRVREPTMDTTPGASAGRMHLRRLGSLIGVGWLAVALATPRSLAQIPQDAMPLDLAAERDPVAARHSFVEIATERETWYLGESVPVQIRVGIEQDFQSSLLPLFRRELSLPVQVLAPWLDDLPPGPPARPPARAAASLVLNDEVAHVHPTTPRTLDGRAFVVFEITRLLRPDRIGALELSGSALRLAYATEFREQLFAERVPSDPRVAMVPGNDLTLRIDAPPEEGQPLEFGGAVGSFELRAELDRDMLRVGEGLRLSLRIEGTGNLGHFDAPRLPTLERFILRGMSEETSGSVHTIHWDFAASSSGPGEIPPITLAFLEPGPPARYRSRATPALPVDVLPGVGVEAEPEPRARSSAGVPAPPSAGEDVTRSLLAGTLLTALALTIGWVLVRRRASRAAHAEVAGSTQAPATFRTQASQPDADIGGLMCNYLAERLTCTPAAIVGPSLTPRLLGADIPPDLAGRTSDHLEQWIATRFGGPVPLGGATDAMAIIDELERAFRNSAKSQPT